MQVGGDLRSPVGEELANDESAVLRWKFEPAGVGHSSGRWTGTKDHLESTIGIGRQIAAIQRQELFDAPLGEVGGHRCDAEVADRPDRPRESIGAGQIDLSRLVEAIGIVLPVLERMEPRELWMLVVAALQNPAGIAGQSTKKCPNALGAIHVVHRAIGVEDDCCAVLQAVTEVVPGAS